MDDFFIFIGLVVMIAGTISLFKPIKALKISSRRTAAFVLMGGFVLSMIGASLIPPDEVAKEVSVQEKPVKEDPAPAATELQGKLTAKPNKDKNTVTLTIETNAPDGAIFETIILNGALETVSGKLVAKGGKATADYAIPKEWGPCWCSASSILRFNLDSIIQPENVKALYGEHGEKMTGALASKTLNVEGNNGNLEVITFAYPDEATVTAFVDEQFNKVINELINTSDGLIQSITPIEDWKTVEVVISDAWYYSPQYEQERFVMVIQEALTNIAIQAGKIEESSSVMVFVEDSYGKELARSGIFGGVKIYD